jgi:hypothetical protein
MQEELIYSRRQALMAEQSAPIGKSTALVALPVQVKNLTRSFGA